VLAINIIYFSEANSQTNDSLYYKTIIKQHKKELKSAIVKSLIPGYSQIKNKDYYSIPVYYTSLAIFGTLSFSENKKYKQEKENYYNYFSQRAPYSFYSIRNKQPQLGLDLSLYESERLNSEYNTDLQLILDNMRYHKTIRNFCITGFALTYMVNLAEGIAPVEKNYHSPYKAALYSALIPGLGQIYNEEYWKLPLVYAGFGIFAFFINYNNDQYKSFLEAYLIRKRNDYDEMMYSNNDLVKYYSFVSDETFLRLKDTWKRYRDYCILGTAAFYGINIIDAMVFAYLKDYDVSENLSIKLNPKINFNNLGSAEIGINLTLNF
jgi:hypothetical protein